MPWLNRDGVGLFYEEAGSGAPPILLVHGWTGDHTYLAPQFEHFRRNHRVVAVDLRGYGQSDKPQQDYTMAAFADDLAWLCGQLSVTKPVVVGASMGGVIALDLAARFPGLPAAVVALDSPILAPKELVDRLRPLAGALHSPAYRDAARQFISNLFIPTDDQERKAKIIERVTATPQHVMASAFEQALSWDSAAAAAACKVPVLNISFAGLLLTDLVRWRELCPQLLHGQTVGAGHFGWLEVPDQVNAMIDRFLAVAVR